MTTITINYIEFNPTVTVPTAVDIYYKLKSLPDVPANWTTVITDLMVNPSGFIPGGLNISLDDYSEYTIRVFNKCGGYYDEDIISSSINNISYNSVSNQNLALRVVAYNGPNISTPVSSFYEYNQTSLPNNSFNDVFNSNGITKLYVFISPSNGYISGYITIKINGVQVYRNRVGTGKSINNIILPALLDNNIEISFDQTYWEELDHSCQQQGSFSLEREIMPLISPSIVLYDDVNQLSYIYDYDRAAGNVGWFDPLTITSPSDITWSTAMQQSYMYGGRIDLERRKIYGQGRNSNGIIIYDIDTDTAKTVNYGDNGIYKRGVMAYRAPNKLYLRDSDLAIIYIFNMDTEVIEEYIDMYNIPNSEMLRTFSAISIYFIGDNILVCPQNMPQAGDRDMYRLYSSDFSTLLHSFRPPDTELWSPSINIRQTASYIQEEDILFIQDWGSNNIYIYRASTLELLHQEKLLNSLGKRFVNTTVRRDVYTGEYGMRNYWRDFVSESSGPLYTYYIELYPFKINRFYKDIQPPINRITGTPLSQSPFPFQNQQDGGDWSTDGRIQIFTNAAPGGNSGIVAIDNILEKYLGSNIPTGATKGNVPSDPDHLNPYFSPSICNLEMNLNCPETVFTYLSDTSQILLELSFANSVVLNGSINRIRIIALDEFDVQIGDEVIIYAPLTNYIKAYIESGTEQPALLRLEYINSSDTVMDTCDLIN